MQKENPFAKTPSVEEDTSATIEESPRSKSNSQQNKRKRVQPYHSK